MATTSELSLQTLEAGSVPAGVAGAVGEEDPFRWGSRLVMVPTAGGGTEVREVPLTWEDLLDPQEGDIMTYGSRHGLIIRDLATKLDRWFASQGREDVAVYDDVKMIWEDPELSRVGPDISVIPGVRDKERNRPSFRVAEEGVGPCLVIEIVSPEYAKLDYKVKPQTYRRAGVPECLIFDLLRRPIRVLGYRLNAKTGRYNKIRPDRSGRLYSETTNLYFSADKAAGWVIVEDAATGQRLPGPDEEAAAREAAERRAAQEARRATDEAAAREAAERRAAQEARRAAQEARRATDEAAAREAAERRAAEAEAELARLKAKLAQRHDS